MKKPKIRNTFIYLNFKKWLKGNLHRFKVRPYITEIESKTFTLAFQNVDNIKIVFSYNSSVNVFALRDIKKKGIPEHTEFTDILTDFFFAETKGVEGYYCSFCETPVYCKDRPPLWEDHIYEPLLEWANENLVPDKYLCFYEVGPYDSSWTKLLSSTDLKKDMELKYRIQCNLVQQP